MTQIKRNGITLTIKIDEYYEKDNPRNNNNLGKMICFHSRYNLGDKNYFESYDDCIDYFNENKNDIACVLPIYMLDHSGIAISVNDFYDSWDSGQVGFIYCTNEDVVKRKLKTTDIEKVKQILIEEVEEYNEYLQDEEFYQFQITDENDELIDSMTGFQGIQPHYFLNNMKEYVDVKYHFLFDELEKRKECEL